MRNTKHESKYFQQDYFACLERITETHAKTHLEFVESILKEIMSFTLSDTMSFFESDKNSGNLNLILSSGEVNLITSDFQGFLSKIIKSGSKTPLLVSTEDIKITSKYNVFSPRSIARICIIPIIVRDKTEAAFVLVRRSTNFHIGDTPNIQILLNLCWKFSAHYKIFEATIKQKEKTEENEKIKNILISNFSHDIRTPVNAIVGFSNLLAESDTDSEVRKKYVNIILGSSEELMSVTRNFTEISNLEKNLERTIIQEVNIKNVMQEISDIFSVRSNTRNTKLVYITELEKSETVLNIDKDKFNLILYALVETTLKFSYSDEVVLRCKRTDGLIEFSVADTGTGIPLKFQEAIANLFSSGEKMLTQESLELTSSGLVLAYIYAKHLNGNLWFSSKEGIGSAFFFNLPFVPGQPETKMDSVFKVEVARRKKKIILVAEDDSISYSLIERIISKEGYKIIRAENGQEAVDICKSNEIDLILMDIKMPVMDGYVATKLILDDKPDMKIIAQTAYLDRDFAIKMGCVDFIAKPFGKGQLIALIDQYLK